MYVWYVSNTCSFTGLEDALKVLLGTQGRLSEVHTSVVIPAYELETSSPFTFWHKHSSTVSRRKTGYIAMQRSEDTPGLNAFSMSGAVRLVTGRDFRLWEVARASSAAPTYFPSDSLPLPMPHCPSVPPTPNIHTSPPPALHHLTPASATVLLVLMQFLGAA